MQKQSIAAIILTKNEEKHIERCIRSLNGICDEIIVVDCFSTDKTCEIAEKLGARVVQHAWTNYALQFNYALYETNIKSDWIWRIDADEYLCDGLGEDVKRIVNENASTGVNGIYVRRCIDFMGKPLLHGGWYPIYHLKIFRRGHGECENRWMNEHIRLYDGQFVTVDEGCQVDDNLNDLTWWTEKHNGYASREMIDMLLMEYELDEQKQSVVPKFFGTSEQRKRWLKLRYLKFPLFVRPFVNFFVRYICKVGFLDGKAGFVWHILQGFWYRMLVDAKIYEMKKNFNFDEMKIKEYLKANYCHKKRGGVILLSFVDERRRYVA